MLNRILIIWIVFAGAVGFAAGGSFYSAYLMAPVQHEPTDWATAILAFATVALGIATIGLYVAGEKQFASANRPHIRLKHIWLATPDGERFFGKLQTQSPVIVRLDIVNTGNTTAFVSAINFVTVIVMAGSRLPQRPPYDEPSSNPRFEVNRALESGITLTHIANNRQILSNSDIGNVRSGTHRLYFIGTIEYWWGNDRKHHRQTAFCRYLSGPSGRFEIDNDPDYEYQD